MQNKWLMLVICGLQLIAAEKNRDWQTGQVVESKTLSDPRDHAIASGEKIYLVKGSIGGAEDALATGAAVRFAVEDKTMFISLAGKEYKLSVLGVRSAAAKPAAPQAPKAAAEPAPAPSPKVAAVAAPAPAPATPAAPPSDAIDQVLDNDAVVKMIVGGLKEDTVVSVIQARAGRYTLTPDALLALKAAGVPQNVIAAMTAKMKR
jgi:hypothetical protein